MYGPKHSNRPDNLSNQSISSVIVEKETKSRKNSVSKLRVWTGEMRILCLGKLVSKYENTTGKRLQCGGQHSTWPRFLQSRQGHGTAKELHIYEC